jgi:repressor LexA
MNLTSKQHEIVKFIWSFRRAKGIAPTLSEIADQMGVSKITVHEHIALLEKKGAIKKEKYQSRSLKLSRRVVKELEELLGTKERKSERPPADAKRLVVPLLGKIAAGRPIEAVEDREEVDLADAVRFDRASYALRVRGDSMIEDGIHDGDLVLVDKRAEARDGETVVAILEGEEATLKRFYRAGDHYKLVPANAALQPIEVEKDKLEIRGVVVGVVRRY